MANGESRHDGSRANCLGGRREFFRQMGAGTLAAACFGGFLSNSGQAAESIPSDKTAPLPTISLVGKTITRLLVGSNPIQGASQPTLHVQRHMNEYYTVEHIADLFIHCEKVGINTFQGSYSDKVRDGLRLARERGSKIQWLCLAADTGDDAALENILALKPFAVVHHGGVTDRLFREGKPDKVHDFIKKIHDKGLAAGVSSHVPNNVRAVEEKDWGNDFFMTCFYNVVRTKEEMKRDFGGVAVDSLSYWAGDPDAMTAIIRQSRKPCLAFKILAAGRLCWSPDSVEQTFQYAFRNIKPTDAVIVGMYPRFEDEPQANAALTRKYGRTA